VAASWRVRGPAGRQCEFQCQRARTDEPKAAACLARSLLYAARPRVAAIRSSATRLTAFCATTGSGSARVTICRGGTCQIRMSVTTAAMPMKPPAMIASGLSIGAPSQRGKAISDGNKYAERNGVKPIAQTRTFVEPKNRQLHPVH
jgi:hypothetical protein